MLTAQHNGPSMSISAGKCLWSACAIPKSQQEAEDILQEAFIKIFDHIKHFRRECPLEGWIRRIIVNTALNYNRSKLYLYPALDLDDIEQPVDESITLADFHFEELLAMVQQLAPRYQVVFNLYAIEGYSP